LFYGTIEEIILKLGIEKIVILERTSTKKRKNETKCDLSLIRI